MNDEENSYVHLKGIPPTTAVGVWAFVQKELKTTNLFIHLKRFYYQFPSPLCLCIDGIIWVRVWDSFLSVFSPSAPFMKTWVETPVWLPVWTCKILEYIV